MAVFASSAGLRYVTPVTSVPEPDRGRLARQRGKDRPALEHRIGDGTDAGDLVQVIHHRDEAEPRLLGGPRLFDDPVEQALVGCVGERVDGKVQAEPGFTLGLRGDGEGSRRPS